MKKTDLRFLFGLLIVIAMVSCKQNTIKTEEKDFTKKYYLSKDTAKGALSLDIQVEIPTKFASQPILDSIRKTIITNVFGEQFVKFSNDSVIPMFVSSLYSDYKMNNEPLLLKLDKKSKYAFNNEHSVEGFSLLSDKHIYTYGIDRYVYMGGAHGLNTRYYFNFDLSNGQLICEEDLYKTGYEKKLTELIRKKIIEDIKENQEANSRAVVDWDDTAFWVDSIKPNCNFYITDESINYVFNPYEIAPYFIGETEVSLPFELIKDLLKPNSIINYLIENQKK